MDVPDGMMAVVRGMQNAALCVTLLDGARQYTLLPNSAVPVAIQPATYVQSTQKTENVQSGEERGHCDSSAQAVDGRYASVYKMTHCKMAPTSPPVALTEFPPQRAELCPGQGNFEVGGQGSGENNCYAPIKNSGSFRGGMCWPDRGAVCSPRASHSPDAFASSLRKYPSLSPERSAELVERLVNYSQLKNSKNLKNCSPTRSESPIQNQTRLSRSSRRLEPECVRCSTPDDSPTREKQRFEETEYRRVYGRSYDVRYVREVSRRTRDSVRNVTTYPYSHPVCPTIKERYDHLPPEQKYLAQLTTSSYVNMETQAEIPMVSREVTTVPRVQPSVRNVAIPLSPSSSNSDTEPNKCIRKHNASKYIQTTEALDLTLKTRKSVQTCFSSVDIQESKKMNNKRKSKSQEELRMNDNVEEEIIQLIEDLTSCPDLDRENVIRSKLLRKLRKIHKIDRSERVKIKIGRCIKDQLYSEIDLKNFTRELSNELISKIKRHNIFLANNPTNAYRAEACSFKSNHEENCVDEIIKEWLNDIPIKSIDYFGRDIKKGHLLHSIATKVRTLIINKLKYNSDSTMKADIIEIVEDLPIDISGHNKRFYINRLVSELMKKIKGIFTSSHAKRKWRKTLENPCKYFQLTEKEMRLFVREEITEFIAKFRIKVCPETLNKMERQITGVLLDSIEIVRLGNIEDVKEDILEILADFVGISEQQAIYFANNIIYNLKDMFDQTKCMTMPRSQTFMVLQNSIQNQCGTIKNTENSIEAISQGDIDINLNHYTNQIVQEINEWSNDIKGFEEIDSGFRQVVVNDLAGDIVDRHKYLELNPSSKKTDSDELEHLKYQIFKWINKVSGEYNLDTIDRAGELMKRIQKVPVPMLTMPQQNGKPQSSCCKNANITVPNVKPEAVQSTSKGRRFSSPDHYEKRSEPRESLGTGKQFIDQNKIPDVAIPENSDCCNPHDETTESQFNASMGVTSTPKKNAPYADPLEVQHRMQQPQGPCVSMMEQPTNRTPETNRRMSLPTGSLCSKQPDTEATKSRLTSPSRTNKINCCTNTSSKGAVPHESQSIKQLNDEYDEFVRDWVQKIPVEASSPAEQALAEKARLGIYNGIWKAITKLKMNPATMNNPFYYQDVFDDEIEELLGLLPQTSELVNKKHAMKAQLIEKTTAMNEMIVSAAGPSTYKQQLVENVSNNLPGNKMDKTGKDDVQQYEELLKMNLVENFILYTKFKAYDKVKAIVFKKKVMKEVHELINSVKANHGKELKDIDAAAYVEEIIIALQKVPLPSEDTIREEVDEINIGLEIEQWFSDLPLLPSNNNVEELGRRRYKDSLAKKIHDIERQSPLAEFEGRTKDEVRRFLARMPLKPGETDNINFMVEELSNRLKNRPTDIIALGGERKKSVSFMDAYEYNDFSRDMPACSSFSDLGRPAQANQSSYMIADGTRVKDNDPYARYINLNDNTPESQQQWYTLEETVAPPGLQSPGQASHDAAPPCCTSQTGGSTSLPQPQTSNQLPITCSSSCQTPKSLTIHEPEIPGRSSFERPKCCESPQKIDQSPQCCDQVAQSSDKDFQQFDHDQSIVKSPQRCDQGTQHFDQSREYAPETESDYDKPRTCEASCKSKRSSAPPSYKTEGTEPMGTQTPDFQPMRQFRSPKSTIPSAHTCDPIGYSTLEQCGLPPSSPRPKKRTKDVERRKDARRKLVMDDTENESEEELRCRCMEKMWRCRRKSVYPNYGNEDYVPCFMRYPPHPCFF